MENKLEFLKSIVPFNLLSDDILLGIIDVVEEISYIDMLPRKTKP